MAERAATTPADCGLAIALPADLASVADAMAGGPFHDYVGRAGYLGSAERIWERGGFAKVAEAAIALAREARSRGVRVVEGARLGDLTGLFANCKVVTLVAHWRGPDLTGADIKVDVKAFIDRLRGVGDFTGRALSCGLDSAREQHIVGADDEVRRRSRLAEFIGARLRSAPPIVASPHGGTWHLDAVSLWHVNRAALDAWWPEAIEPGNRLELADGLHDSRALAATIPGPWSGIVDLSNCQSMQLFEAVKQGRDDRTVICNLNETDALSRIAVIRTVYTMLRDGQMSYIDARASLATALRENAQRCR